jgi:hypothetical protein
MNETPHFKIGRKSLINSRVIAFGQTDMTRAPGAILQHLYGIAQKKKNRQSNDKGNIHSNNVFGL